MNTDNLNLKSRIFLLKKCIEFYADEANYSNHTIELDAGSTAKHILEVLKKLEEYDMEMETLYNTLQGEIDSEEIIKKIKKITNKYDGR